MARPGVHAIVSGVLGVILWRRTGSRVALAAPIVGGFLIDADHLVDYALRDTHFGREIVILPLHGWELVPLFWLLEWRVRRVTGGGFTVGYLTHLLVDQVTNEKRSPLVYFLAYRASRHFSSDLLGSQRGVSSMGAHPWRQSSLRELWRWFL